MAVIDKKSLPTVLPYPPLPSSGASGSGGVAGGSPTTQQGGTAAGGTPSSGGGGGGGSGEEENVKDRIQKWIQQQAGGFLEKWAGPSHSNPAHQVVSRLKEAAQGLDPKSPSCLASLNVSA